MLKSDEPHYLTSPTRHSTSDLSLESVHLGFLFEHSRDLILLLDLDGCIIRASASSAEQLGFSADELLGKQFSHFFHPDEQSTARTTRQSPAQERQTWRIRHRLNFYIWVEMVVQQIPTDEQALVILYNISEQKALEEQLHNSQTQDRILNDSTTDLISRHTFDGRYIFASPASRPMLGYLPDDLYGRPILELIHPEDVSRMQRTFQEMQAASEQLSVTYRIRHRDQTWRWFESRCRIVQGEPPTIIAIARDITPLKQAQFRVQQQTHQLIALEEMGKAVTATLELDQILALLVDKLMPMLRTENTSILLLENKRWHFAATTGLFAERYRAASMSFSEPMFQSLLTVKEPRIIHDATVETVRPQVDGVIGEVVPWRSFIFAPLLVQNEVIGLIGGVHREPNVFHREDIQLLEAVSNWAAIAIYNANLFKQATTRGEQLRKLTNKVVEAQEAERASLSRELHDESGQSLTALRIQLGLVRSQVATFSADIAEQLNGSLDLISNTMQRLSRIAKAMRPLALDRVGLHSAIESLCRNFSEHTQIDVTFHGIEIELPEAASVTLYRVVQEALTNIGKHAEASNVTISMQRDTHQLTVRIEDDGVGIENAQQTALSSSLGLLGMRERLDLLNGTLIVASAPAQGTTLTATIPLQP